MSDIQDLIHKTSMDCIERGKVIERERIIKLLIDCHLIRKEGNSYFTGFNGDEDCTDVIELIKGETKCD